MLLIQHSSHGCKGTATSQLQSAGPKPSSWGAVPLSPALVTAARLLQQHPHLAAAASISSYSSRSTACAAAVHTTCPHHVQQQWVGCCSSRCSNVQAVRCCSSEAARVAAEQPPAPANAAAAVGDSSQQVCADASTDSQAAVQGQSNRTRDPAAAAAALARLQQVTQQAKRPSASPFQVHAAAASSTGASSSGSSGVKPGQQQLLQPVRPAQDRQAALQQLEQQAPRQPDHMLTWRSRRAATAAGPQQQDPVPQQPLAQQQQQLPAPPLEPSIGPGGQTYLTSPVSFVAADTSTKALAGSISIAFAVHQHQLLFAVGPYALGVSMKALATARVMLAAENGAQPVNILMQPTLRGGRTVRNQSYALDIARVGELPMRPGGDDSDSGASVVYGESQSQQQRRGSSQARSRSRSSSSGGGGNVVQQQRGLKTDVKMVHITTTSNELAAARSLVENMPARGQTVMRVAGPYATETAVLAVALARPLFRQKYGQDLAILVMWNDATVRYKKQQTGLLLSVFRCAVDSFPPEVLLLPPSQRNQKRQQYWERQQQKKGGKKQQPQQEEMLAV